MTTAYFCFPCNSYREPWHVDGHPLCPKCSDVCVKENLCETCGVRECCGPEYQCIQCIAADAVQDPAHVKELLHSTQLELATYLAWQQYHAANRNVRLAVAQAG
jgi:hypothetical protein